jgi:predicted outer membrane lipoprotein
LLILALPFAAALAILGGFWYYRAKAGAAPRQ